MSEIQDVTISSTSVFLTPEGYKRLQAELEVLTTQKRQEIAERLRESKEHGEFSEDNNELEEVKFEQAIIENRINDLKLIFAGAQVVDSDLLNDKEVNIGNYVEVKDDRGMQFEVRVVSSIEADPDHDYVSNESPMGTALLGAKMGETIEFEAPAGKLKYKVVKIRK
ncbi:MAG: transcription elongation factor GreA [Fimbriimonadaceae bacterium]|nr:transcription elongation factor GreA [Fimbriimonadaceae bacterium]